MKKNSILYLMVVLLAGIFLQGCVAEKASGQSKGISTPFSKGTTSQKKKALIVGVSDYAGDHADLGGIERDVAKMKALFGSWGFDVNVLYDNDSMDIVKRLNEYGNSLDADDFFAFYYTGHGSHIKDVSGDESDGEDETLVLSDGNSNKHLMDDILYQKFNAIKAKKLIFFDSCHSGTVFRSLNGKTQPKTIKPEDVTQSFVMSSSKGMKVADSMSSSNGEYIVFSSSQDTEESLATPAGSLFTNSVSEVFSDSSLSDKSLKSINDILVTKVVNYAKETDGTPHHPNISFSNPSIGAKSLRDFVSSKSIVSSENTVLSSSTNLETGTLQNTLDSIIDGEKIKKMSLSYNKTTYKSGEFVEFSLDTKGEKGYLSIFHVSNNDITILYPNPFVDSKQINGQYSFSKDLSGGKFKLEAYKSCSDCKEEKTVIYTLLSARAISDASAIRSRDGLISFAEGTTKSKVMTRAVRINVTATKNGAFQPQLAKYEFVVR